MAFLQSILAVALPIVVLALGIGTMMAIVAWWRHSKDREEWRSPFSRGFLRVPGESCDEKIQDLNLDFDCYLMLAISAPLTVFSIHVSQMHFGEINAGWGHTVFIVASIFQLEAGTNRQ